MWSSLAFAPLAVAESQRPIDGGDSWDRGHVADADSGPATVEDAEPEDAEDRGDTGELTDATDLDATLPDVGTATVTADAGPRPDALPTVVAPRSSGNCQAVDGATSWTVVVLGVAAARLRRRR